EYRGIQHRPAAEGHELEGASDAFAAVDHQVIVPRIEPGLDECIVGPVHESARIAALKQDEVEARVRGVAEQEIHGLLDRVVEVVHQLLAAVETIDGAVGESGAGAGRGIAGELRVAGEVGSAAAGETRAAAGGGDLEW